MIDVPTPAAWDPQIADDLLQIVREVLKVEIAPQDFTADTNLYEAGLESLRVVEVLAAVEKRFDIVIDVEDLSAELFSRFGNVVAFVRRKIDESR